MEEYEYLVDGEQIYSDFVEYIEYFDNLKSYQIKTQEGGIVNWYPKTGTVLVQGKEHIRKKINDYLKKSLE